MARVRIRMHHIFESLHKDTSTRVCVCVLPLTKVLCFCAEYYTHQRLKLVYVDLMMFNVCTVKVHLVCSHLILNSHISSATPKILICYTILHLIIRNILLNALKFYQLIFSHA